MAINLNNYGYSYANAVGNALKQPFFILVSNSVTASRNPRGNQALRIAKIAFHCSNIFFKPL